ncbi:MAG: hypothetical protein H6686_04690 [Fibrobacteria bacterium]|nr:hypothetical protein [Fibrobacteria bacterium]
MKSTAGIAIAALLSLWSNGGSASPLVNGDFERGLEGWRIWGGVATPIAHSGKGACEIVASSDTWAGIDQVVGIPSGMGRLTLTGWLMADGIRQGPEEWNKGRLGVDFLDDRDSMVGTWQMVAIQVRGKVAWSRGERTYEIPPGATRAKIICALANAHGTLRCDDIEANFTP